MVMTVDCAIASRVQFTADSSFKSTLFVSITAESEKNAQLLKENLRKNALLSEKTVASAGKRVVSKLYAKQKMTKRLRQCRL